MKYTIASGPVIVENSKALLNKHGDDKFWKFIGGRIKEWETFKQCAIRRAKEEMSVEAKPLKPLKPMLIWKDDEVIILVHFLAKRMNQKIEPADFVKEWKWIPIDNLPKDVGPNILPVLESIK